MMGRFLVAIILVFTLMSSRSILGQQEIAAFLPKTLLDIQYSPEDAYLARIYADGRLEVSETIRGTIILEYVPDPPLLDSLVRARVDWSPKGNLLAAGIGARIYIWDIEAKRLLHSIAVGNDGNSVYFESGHYIPEGVVSLQWSSDEKLLLAQSLSARYTVWSQEQQAFIFDEIIGNNPVPVVWLSDNRRISHGITTLDIETEIRFGDPSQQMLGISSKCGVTSSVANNTDRTQIAVGTHNGCIIILDADAGNQIAAYKIADDGFPIRDIAWSADSTAVAAVTEQGSVRIVDVLTGDFVIARQEGGPLHAIDWSNAGNEIAYGGHAMGDDAAFATLSAGDIRELIAIGAVQQPEIASTPSTQLD